MDRTQGGAAALRQGGGWGGGARGAARAILGAYLHPRERRATVKYVCPCGYVYDPEAGDPDSGIAPGTSFEDIPDDWVCPVCGLSKDMFEPAE